MLKIKKIIKKNFYKILVSSGNVLSTIFASCSIGLVQLLSCVWLFVTPWTAACRLPCPSLSLRVCADSCLLNWWCYPNISSCHSLLFLPSIFPSIKVFSNESVLHIRWPKYWSFSFRSVLPMNIQDWLPLGGTGSISLQSKGLSRVFSTVQKHQFFSAQL